MSSTITGFRAKKRILSLLAALLLLLGAAASGVGGGAAMAAAAQAQAQVQAQQPEYAVAVDTSKTGADINRGLFSVVNYPRFSVEAGKVSADEFMWLGPAGSQARIETQMAEMEPANDDNDPNHFNWSGFHPDKLFRFIDDKGHAFIAQVTEVGMEPVLLLAYNAPWLSATGKVNAPPADLNEWAEFAAAAIQSVNGDPKSPDYKPFVKYVEIWNEPGQYGDFWMGGRDQYYKLFNVAAKRIHRDFPGVLVGGPGFLDPTTFQIEEFADMSAKYADFYVFHWYNDAPDQLVAKIQKAVKSIKSEGGVKNPKIMVTESDNFLIGGADKFNYLMQRQLEVLGISDLLVGFHQFCLPAYQEGDRFFGLIYPESGGVIGANYWPYWIFRDYRGRSAAITVGAAGTAGAPSQALSAVASYNADTATTDVVLYLPPTKNGAGGEANAAAVSVNVTWPKSAEPMEVAVSNASAEGGALGNVQVLPVGATSATVAVSLAPGTAAAVTVKPAASWTEPWVNLAVAPQSLLIGNRFDVKATIVNTTENSISGRVALAGAPADWDVSVVGDGDSFAGLKSGESFSVSFSVKALSAASATEKPALYAYVRASDEVTGNSFFPHSAAIPVTVLAPVAISAQPARLYIAPGATEDVAVGVADTMGAPVDGEVGVLVPTKWPSPEAQSYQLDTAAKGFYRVKVTAPAAAAEGDYQATVQVTYRDVPFTIPLPITVKEYDATQISTPLDLAKLYNADAITTNANRGDVANYGGPFSLAAEELPQPGAVRYLGTTFAFPDYADGKMNAVQALGQSVAVTSGRYKALAMLANATNGSAQGEFTLVYVDGTKQTVKVAATDWCQAPKNGEIPVILQTHRHQPTGDLYDAPPAVFCEVLPVDPAKELKEVILPAPGNQNLYVFALSLVAE